MIALAPFLDIWKNKFSGNNQNIVLAMFGLPSRF